MFSCATLAYNDSIFVKCSIWGSSEYEKIWHGAITYRGTKVTVIFVCESGVQLGSLAGLKLLWIIGFRWKTISGTINQDSKNTDLVVSENKVSMTKPYSVFIFFIRIKAWNDIKTLQTRYLPFDCNSQHLKVFDIWRLLNESLTQPRIGFYNHRQLAFNTNLKKQTTLKSGILESSSGGFSCNKTEAKWRGRDFNGWTRLTKHSQ